jgi:hypothetical protein
MPSILPPRIFTICFLLLAGTALLPAQSTHTADSAAPAKHKYTDDVAKLAAAPAPVPGGILMVGSSIFRKWTNCTEDLAPLPVTNRAFGGSRTKDQLFFFDQIVPSSQAALIVWYCGSNDVKGDVPPGDILKNTKEWITRTQAALPQARVLLVSVIRALQKREDGQLANVDEVNDGLRGMATSIPGVAYVDVNPAMETPSGEAIAGCYAQDKLHLTPEGYRLMNSALRPAIEKEWHQNPAEKSPQAAPVN